LYEEAKPTTELEHVTAEYLELGQEHIPASREPRTTQLFDRTEIQNFFGFGMQRFSECLSRWHLEYEIGTEYSGEEEVG
jgi:hypothetical protein